MKKRIRVLADYECYPLWIVGDGTYDNVSAGTLPISSDLARALDSWALEYTGTLNRADPISSGFGSEAAERDFVRRGLELATRLRGELGDTYDVTFFDETQQRDVAVGPG